MMKSHSVLSKARTRWGVAAFRTFFERIVWQCVDAGLVDGGKLFMDSCLIQANASNNSVVNKESLTRYLNKSYQTLDSRLDEQQDDSDDDDDPKPGAANKKHISTTDADASVTRKGKGKSKLKYQVHRGVDHKCEIITATEVTPGSVNEAHRLKSLLKRHLRQDELDIMLEQTQSPAAKRDIKTRQHLMERSFARATRYGLQQARWRRLWRVQIQEYLTATIQNLMVLLSNIKEPSAALGRRISRSCFDKLLINLHARIFIMLRAFAY